MKRIIETAFDLRRRTPVLRRGFLRTAAGAGVVLSSGLSIRARADDDRDDDEREKGRCGQPLPVRYSHPGPFGSTVHAYFPGPIDGSLFPTDGTGAHPEGRDPSTITNFAGVVGQVDAVFSGTGTDTMSGAEANYSFHTDTRFIKGQFIGSDEQIHRGAFAFI
ncbi:MAG TPA: hypothetical protein VJN43_05620 [Bryobacteraceae bacterium]|nr:hypothetical protein [Bryobacteraceae bacterium]